MSSPALVDAVSRTAGPNGSDLAPMMDELPIMVGAASVAGTVDYVNGRAIEYAGLSRDAFPVGLEKWLELVHPDDRDTARRAWRDALGTADPVQFELRIRRADGVYRWFRCRAVPRAEGDDGTGRWLATFADIDDQKTAQHDADEMTALLDAVQAGAPIGWGFGDLDCRYVRVNQQLAAINNRPREDHPGRLIADVIPDRWPQVEPAYRRVLETGEPVTEHPVNAPTGERWLVSYYPVRVAGELTGVGFVIMDVTAALAAEAFRAAVMDHMAEGLCTMDEHGLVTSVNLAATRLLGWTEKEVLGRSLHEVLHATAGANAHAAADCPLTRIRSAGEQVDNAEDRYVHRDGAAIDVAYSASPMRVGESVAGVVVVFRDVTEQKDRQRRELEGRHDQKLEALGRLSAGLAHEINTPIQFVGDNTRFLAEAYQTMLELLLVYRDILGPQGGQLPWEERKKRAEDAEEKADIEYLAEEVPGAVEQSLEGIDRVASLVRAMKAFSYKDTKEHSYADINEGIRTTVIVARNEVKYVADVVLDLDEQLPDVLCNLGDLNQVFLNLLVNAADAMPEGGERGKITVTTRVEGTSVVISFADNGTGIPEDIRKAIFDPFFTTKEVGKGTGQGLALALAVCEKHGGTIEVQSELGVGTEFILTLPIAGKRSSAA
ncbi:PAS domain S-box protein [Actinoplanes subtropicus]|uniref:PAS domain S-box protein n=1 Tax=Actinoplanes subtropicus TaxID=543632 RepID=UPI0007C56E35|nr:PAS domain S-box protein [Actinoplanes subtropicus]